MSIFKKYKLWWLITCAVFSFMLVNAVAFAFTGMSLITPLSAGQALMQVFLFFVSGFLTLMSLVDGVNLKG